MHASKAIFLNTMLTFTPWNYCLYLFIVLILFDAPVKAQHPRVEILTSGTKTSLRGLSVVNDNVIWVSGSNGMVGRSSNAGKNWNWFTVKGYEKIEFRDIEGFDGQTAVIMGVGEPAYILKTTDGGQSWKLVYENKTKGMFLDAMDFSSDDEGMVVGDPIDGKVFMALTHDGGETWKELEADKRPKADSGEAFFAASGTNIRLFRNMRYFLASGGTHSRVITDAQSWKLPLLQGKETTGANSIAVFDDGSNRGSKKWIVVGGDFANDSSTVGNCAYTSNGGKSWKSPVTPPHGYRSCVEYLSPNDVIACGLNGVDYSLNSGRDWIWISREGFNVCRISNYGFAVFFAGNNGKIGRLAWR
jgi:photosystem II stability/assembly factor-like uncharacterized protein